MLLLVGVRPAADGLDIAARLVAAEQRVGEPAVGIQPGEQTAHQLAAARKTGRLDQLRLAIQHQGVEMQPLSHWGPSQALQT